MTALYRAKNTHLFFGLFFVVLLSISLGLVSASGSNILKMIAVSGISGLLLLALPINIFVGVLVLVTLAIQGNLSYFFRFNQAQWIPYLLCMIAILRFELFPFSRHSRQTGQNSLVNHTPIIFLFLYILCLIFSTIANTPGLEQTIVGIKNALPIWIITFLIIYTRNIENLSKIIWNIFYSIFFLQIPFVLYQHFVVVPGRQDRTTAMDAVVGTFGGLIDGGGSSSVLVAFALFVLIFEISKFIRGVSSLSSLLFVLFTALLITLSGEVKAAFLWLPICIIFVLRQKLLKNPLTFVASLATTFLFVAALFAAYDVMYWQQKDQKSASDRIERMQYFYDTKNINYHTGEVSRGASLALWFNDSKTDLPHRLFGYGVGSSRISATGGLGNVAKRFAPLGVAATTTAALLWDTGVFGLVSFIGILFTTFVYAVRVANDKRLPELERAQIEAWGALLLIMATLLIYNRTLLDEPSTQMLLALAVGFVVKARIRLKTTATDSSPSQQLFSHRGT